MNERERESETYPPRADESGYPRSDRNRPYFTERQVRLPSLLGRSERRWAKLPAINSGSAEWRSEKRATNEWRNLWWRLRRVGRWTIYIYVEIKGRRSLSLFLSALRYFLKLYLLILGGTHRRKKTNERDIMEYTESGHDRGAVFPAFLALFRSNQNDI